MPTLARPEVDLLEGLTTAIIVDQERMGANPRSTVGTATDANAMLRILFSRLGQPHIGPPIAFSFNVPARQASGAITVDKGKGERIVVRDAVYHGGMCPRCEGMGTVTDFDLAQLYDDTKSLAEGAITIPGYNIDGWSAASSESRLLRPGQADPRLHREGARRPPPQGADEGQGRRHQPHLRGADPEDPEVDAVQGRRRAAAAHPRLRRAGGHVHDLPRLRRHPAERVRPVLQDQGNQHRRRVRDADQRPGRLGPRPGRAVGGAAADGASAHLRLVRRRSGLATSRSTGRRARCRAARRSASR